MTLSRNRIILAAVLMALSATGLSGCSRDPDGLDRGSSRFRYVVVDPQGPEAPWGKSVGDIDGDGLDDLLVGGHGPESRSLMGRLLSKFGIKQTSAVAGTLLWYENPEWTKHIISQQYLFSTDHEVADIDGDRRADVVSTTSFELLWFRAPNWTPFTIDKRALHDIEVGDLDGDGDVDIVGRNQSRFGHNDGDRVHFYRQDSPRKWQHTSVRVQHGEGLKLADINGDGSQDVVVNGIWLENPGSLQDPGSWAKHPYGKNRGWQDVSIDVADITGDGQADIVLSPAEPKGERYRISYFSAPFSQPGEWAEFVIDPDVEAVLHFVAARDMNNDNRVDIVTAATHEGEYPHEVRIYWNRANGKPNWQKEVVATTGSHNMRARDIDGDGDVDLFGANWSGNHQPVEMWENLTCEKASGSWRRHVIDNKMPWRSVFIMAQDLNRDGYRDVIAGACWYRNPGDSAGNWTRLQIGEPANNASLIMDFDSDGDPDILASQWKGGPRMGIFARVMRKLGLRQPSDPPRGGFVWARNDGDGRFEIMDNIPPAEGDFLQGIAVISSGVSKTVALSWHEAERGIQAFDIPENPARDKWTRRRLSKISQDEGLSAGDIDGDGDPDLVLGTRWLRNEGNGRWTPFVLHDGAGNPDRNIIADLNRDGRPDVVIGYESISAPGKVAWYEQGEISTGIWTEHPIGEVIGPMSLDVGDPDGDGDLEVVVGEHNLDDPESSRLLIFDKAADRADAWEIEVVFTGDEHHDGAQLVDIDNDGDLDILSIGWGHSRVLLFENLRVDNRCPAPE